jgi:hypothetical protein
MFGQNIPFNKKFGWPAHPDRILKWSGVPKNTPPAFDKENFKSSEVPSSRRSLQGYILHSPEPVLLCSRSQLRKHFELEEEVNLKQIKTEELKSFAKLSAEMKN